MGGIVRQMGESEGEQNADVYGRKIEFLKE